MAIDPNVFYAYTGFAVVRTSLDTGDQTLLSLGGGIILDSPGAGNWRYEMWLVNGHYTDDTVNQPYVSSVSFTGTVTFEIFSTKR